MKLIKYLKPYWYFALLAPLMMVVEVLVDLSQPTLMSIIVDNGVVAGDMAVITATGIKMIILVVIGGIGGLSASFFANAAAQSFGCDLRCDAYKKVMSLSLEQTDKFTTGSLVTRLTNDVTAVENLVSMALRMFIRAPLNFIGGIVMAIALDVKFSLVIAIALPIELVLIIFIIGKASPMFLKVQKKLDRVNSVVQENITGARVVKAYVREEHEIDRFDDANTDLYKANMYVQKLMALMSPLMMVIMNASVIAIIVIGGYQVQAGAYEVGKVMAAITYVTQILMSLMMVSMMFQFISRASVSAKRIKEILACEPAVASPGKSEISENSASAKVRGSVVFENVSFRYPGTSGSPVLDGVNLKIEPGEFVAVLGATGSGKTSLVNLIPRFYDVTGGRVLLDGVDVREYNLEELRARIAPVLQKSELYSGTIADNIRMGNEDATDEEVRAAAVTAQADSFISAFKDGYGTAVSEKGASLSGGQKQRISIARALVRKPEVLIFDDSTSALDFGTEARLREALRKNNSDTTIIMIAQRIASVMHADKIAVLENGKITAFDTCENLLKTSPTFRDIYDSQLKNGGSGDEQ